MLRLHLTLALCFSCSLLVALHEQALADEEALWGPTPSREQPGDKPPVKKPSSSWWSLPKLPSFPSLPSPSFSNPFGSWGQSSETKEEEPIDHSPEHSGSGEGSISATFEPSISSTQEQLTSVTEIGTVVLLNGTSDSPHRSAVQINNDSLVSDSYSPSTASFRDTLFSNGPTSTHAPTQTSTQSYPPASDTKQTPGHSMDVTAWAKLFPKERTDKEEVPDLQTEAFTTSSTRAPETTVPTALISTPPKTTTISPALETTLTRHLLGPITPPTSPGKMFITAHTGANW